MMGKLTKFEKGLIGSIAIALVIWVICLLTMLNAFSKAMVEVHSNGLKRTIDNIWLGAGGK